MTQASRGEVWLVDLNSIRGREQAGKRSCLIISVDAFNQSLAELVIAIPITSKDKRIPFHVRLEPADGGVKIVSFIKCEDVRSISVDRLEKCWGSISPEVLAAVSDRLRILMDL